MEKTHVVITIESHKALGKIQQPFTTQTGNHVVLANLELTM